MIKFNPEVWQITYWEITLRLIIAVALGGLVGLEREWKNRSAGFRTHILVCIGSASIMLLSIHGFGAFVYEENVRTDPARLAAQVISGIGFLGAGTIIRNGSSISGLTTAASLWVVAAIGLCVGAGFYYAAALTTGLVLISLYLLNHWEKTFLRKSRRNEVTLDILDRKDSFSQIIQMFRDNGFPVQSIVMESEDTIEHDGKPERVQRIRFTLQVRRREKMLSIIEQISKQDVVLSIDSSELSVQKASQMGGGISL